MACVDVCERNLLILSITVVIHNNYYVFPVVLLVNWILIS